MSYERHYNYVSILSSRLLEKTYAILEDLCSGCFLKAFADIASENDSDLDTYLTLLQVDVLRVHAS